MSMHVSLRQTLACWQCKVHKVWLYGRAADISNIAIIELHVDIFLNRDHLMLIKINNVAKTKSYLIIIIEALIK